MALSAGEKLGPYEIIACIGEGGMGEVYKARDTRLDRMVALKVSKQDFTDRFEREARAVAALNHPHICQIYDVGPNFLVMEYLEGAPLRGPLPLAKAVEYASQILDAMADAHAKKITHRDLKPANILVTKQGIKLLDFGLAKQQTGVVEGSDATVKALTSKGAILGTLQYMSPEQLHGKEADARSDIFSFGCVLYEMLSGKRAFEGESAASIIGAILHQQPAPLEGCPPLAGLIERCMAKEPDERFQTARDLKYSIAMAVSSAAPVAAPVAPVHHAKWVYAAAGIAVVALCAAAWMASKGSAPAEVVRFKIPLQDFDWRSTFALAPNGRQLAIIYSARDSRRQIYVRRLDSNEMRPLAGTLGVNRLAWSPDSTEIAFLSDSQMKKVHVANGVVEDIPGEFKQGSLAWSSTGSFLFSSNENSPLYSRPVSGGSLTAATVLDKAKGETEHALSSLCPDGKHFLYQAIHNDGRISVKVGLLGSPQHQVPLEADARSVCAGGPGKWGEQTYLMQPREESLLAIAFDPSSGRLGESWVLAKDRNLEAKIRLVTASGSGVLAYRTRAFGAQQLIWYDRTGRVLETLPEPAEGSAPSISEDGRYLATFKGTNAGSVIWITDLTRKSSMPLLLKEGNGFLPVLSKDGSRVAYTSGQAIYEADSSGTAARMIAQLPAWPQQYSPDGKHLLYVDSSKRELHAIPLEGEPKPVMIAPAGPTYFPASFSPDGRFVTYTSTETGRPEVYVRAVAPATGKWLISNGGGGMSYWRGDGRELFYLDADVKMMSVDVELTPAFRAGIPKPLFQTKATGVNNNRNNYVVTKDGQRFLILTPKDDVDAGIHVIVNWPSLLKRQGEPE